MNARNELEGIRTYDGTKVTKRFDELDGELRMVAANASEIADALIEAGRVDEAIKYRMIEHFADEWIKKYFGGYNGEVWD